MANYEIGRRQFLMTAAGVVVFPRFVPSIGASGFSRIESYDPAAKFEIMANGGDRIRLTRRSRRLCAACSKRAAPS